MITNSADYRTTNSEGLAASDYIFAKELEHLKSLLQKAIGNQRFECLSSSYTEERLTEIRRVINGPSLDQLKIHDVDTIADTTMLSGMSEILQSVETSPKEDHLAQKIREIQEKTVAAQKRIEKLRKRNNEIKKQLKSKKSSEAICVEKAKSETDAMTGMVSVLTSEIDCYVSWVYGYRRASKPFFENIYEMMLIHIRAFFGKDVSVLRSGSYDNGLIMPWSDLNLVVTFVQDNRSENMNRYDIIESSKRFSKVLNNDRNIVQNCTIEERSSLMILKIKLIKQFKEQQVEIIFKYYVNSAYPSNEDIINEYLERYHASKPLYIIFRTILHRATLDDPSLHGLKSVVIFLMIVAYLQHVESTNSKSLDHMSIGELFLNFLFFYSYGFDYYRDCIQCNTVRQSAVSPFGPKDPYKKISSLMITNPYNEDIILTKSFKRTVELRQLIKLCYISIFSRCCCDVSKEVVVKPKLALRSTGKRSVDSSTTESCDSSLDRYKMTDIRYINHCFKKGPKRSLHIEPNNDGSNNISRASFALPQLPINDILLDELNLYRPLAPRGMPVYMIQTLFNYNFIHDKNI